MQTSLQGIARKAKQDRKHKFGNLYTMIDKQALYIAWKNIKKSSSPGIDKETAKEFKRNLDSNIESILTELKSKKYKAKLIKRVNIPKGNGKTRPLGLPALRDKIIQRAATIILEAIYEQDFLKSSYGYRPKSGAQKAVKEMTKELMGKYSYIVEADIRSFFDNINHEWLIGMLQERIKDKTFIRLIKKWLKVFTQWCKENRHNRIKRIVEALNVKLRGYFNYYGVIGNSKGLYDFYGPAIKILYKWLNRRSQRRSFTWEEFNKKMKWYGLIKPKITEKEDNQIRIEECFA